MGAILPAGASGPNGSAANVLNSPLDSHSE
jgi:hypothetical protein